jgi:hypothetical protein
MKTHNNGRWVVLAAVVAGLTFASSVSAGTPDGFGPWADSVVFANQGLNNDGTPVLPERSDPTAALGEAEWNEEDGTYYSLGFGGSTVLAFQNGINGGALVVESTNEDVWYPTETAKVEISTDGLVFTEIGNVTKEDGQVELPDDFGCAQFVRITDTSDPGLFEPSADGFDVDGVKINGEACATHSRMTGGGTVMGEETNFKHGFQLDCETIAGGHFQMNWGKGNKFHMEKVLASICLDDPAISEGQPEAGFNTYIGVGTGKYNGESGYTIYMTLVDSGEPGVSDNAKVEIRDADDNVMYISSGNLMNGNHQAHE